MLILPYLAGGEFERYLGRPILRGWTMRNDYMANYSGLGPEAASHKRYGKHRDTSRPTT
jgi:hypothetical protein